MSAPATSGGRRTIARVVAALVALAAPGAIMEASEWRRPDAVVDLRTRGGVRLAKGEWRYSDAKIVGTEFPAPGPDLKPSGPPLDTHDLAPAAGGADYDDGAWPVLDPESLEERRGGGKVSFAWYRLRVTIPEKIGAFSTEGSTVVFEIVVDDYAEIWIDGRLPRSLGQSGGSLIAGFNAPNRVVASRGARPGQTVQIAVLAANGPISDPPANYIWIRSATLDFYAPGRGEAAEKVLTTIVRNDPALDRIIAAGSQAERVARGFTFGEGPVWAPEGYLLFSDPDDNTIYRWSLEEGVSIFRVKSGYSGVDIGSYRQPGSNGLALDGEGRLTICEHGNRRVTRLEKNGVLTVLADAYEGRRLNSPNDLVYASDGTLYFTDPPFGLPAVFDDPGKELRFSGIYRLRGGKLDLVDSRLTGPNGIALSPAEDHLYVTNWDPERKVVLRYGVRRDGSLAEGEVFFDMGGAPEPEALDGLEVDREGNLYVSGPGGVWILSPQGRHLGTVRLPELPANFAWGDADRRTLYMTARTSLYRMRLAIPGAHTGEAVRRVPSIPASGSAR